MSNKESMSVLSEAYQKTSNFINTLPPEFLSTKEGQELLDVMDSIGYTKELHADIAEEIDAYEQMAEDMYELTKIMEDNEAEVISNFATNSARNVLNMPDMDEKVMEDMARAFNASYNAQHPIKYAMGQLGAALKAIIEIPKQMADNVRIANEAGLESCTAIQNTVIAAKSRVGSIYNETKSSIITNSTTIASNVSSLYGSAVDGLLSTWTKAKAGMDKALKTVGKGIDIGMEALTLGTWSRMCDAMFKDAQYVGTEYKYSHEIEEKLAKLGYEKDHKLFGKEERNVGKVGIGIEKFNDYLAKATFAMHCKLTGDSMNPEAHQEYWSDVKGKVWNNTNDAREGSFGRVSPIDAVCYKIDDINKSFAEADRQFSQATVDFKQSAVKAGHDLETATKEKAEAVVQFIKDIPENAKKTGERVAGFIGGLAKEAGEKAVETFAKAKAGALKVFAKLVDKVEQVERNAERRNLASAQLLNEKANNTHAKISDLEAELASITGQKVTANYQLPQELESFRKELQAAKSPTAEIKKSLSNIEKIERTGIRNEKVKATVSNMTHMLKHAGVVIFDKLRIDDLKCVEENAKRDFLKHQDKANRQKETVEKIHGFAENLRDKASSIEASIKKEEVEQNSMDMDERE